MNDRQIREIHPGDAEWPTALADLGAAQPDTLWLSGALNLRQAVVKAVAVVGSRASTSYGSHVASELGYVLAGIGVTVVSGGAYGIDSVAHRGAIAADGHTIAVMANGLNLDYPSSHSALFDKIAETGLLVSAYPPGTSPRPSQFLARNGLIAALSQGTVVVEAAMRSGAMSTARQAYGLGRVVMAVPGPVTSIQSQGPHDLIRNGARLVTNAGQVVDAVVAAVGADTV